MKNPQYDFRGQSTIRQANTQHQHAPYCSLYNHITPFLPSINLDETCKTDQDCGSDRACIENQCLDPCSLRGACGEKALCQTVFHKPRCSCPDCHIGRPNKACIPDPNCESIPKRTGDPKGATPCRTDNECPENLRCDHTGQCTSPCESPGYQCEENKKCDVRRHRPVCVCKAGFIVNEYGELICRPEKSNCASDDDCASNMACMEGICRNPCVDHGLRHYLPPCPKNKQCEVLDHKPVCICVDDCAPSVSICLRDNGCPADLACRHYQCVNPCDNATCADNSPCYVENHKPICKFCPPGYIKDAHQGCFKGKLITTTLNVLVLLAHMSSLYVCVS